MLLAQPGHVLQRFLQAQRWREDPLQHHRRLPGQWEGRAQRLRRRRNVPLVTRTLLTRAVRSMAT